MKRIQEVLRGSDVTSLEFVNKRFFGNITFIEDKFQFDSVVLDKDGNVLGSGSGGGGTTELTTTVSPFTESISGIAATQLEVNEENVDKFNQIDSTMGLLSGASMQLESNVAGVYYPTTESRWDFVISVPSSRASVLSADDVNDTINFRVGGARYVWSTNLVVRTHGTPDKDLTHRLRKVSDDSLVYERTIKIDGGNNKVNSVILPTVYLDTTEDDFEFYVTYEASDDEVELLEGEIDIRAGGVNISSADKDLDGYLNSMSLQQQGLFLTVEGSEVYLDIEAVEGGDMGYWLDGIKYVLDCTTGAGVGGRARVLIPQGTSTVARNSVVYVAYSTQLGKVALFTSPTVPAGAIAVVAIIVIQDYSTVSANGALLLQRTTDAVSHNQRGAISFEREKLRVLGALYWSGVDQDVSIVPSTTVEDSIGFTTTNGIVYQLHKQTWGDYDISTRGIWVSNSSGSGTLNPLQKLFDLNEIHEDATGVPLQDGDSINLVIWGSVNYTSDTCKLFVNLPTGKYIVEDDAVSDVKGTAVTTIPKEFRTTGFLIARLVLKYTSDNNGTWVNLLTNAQTVWSTESVNVTSPNYPSDYPPNTDVTSVLTHAGASSVRAHFAAFNTEAGYDFAEILDVNDNNITNYTGSLDSFTTPEVQGDTIKVRFTADGSIQNTGWYIDSLEYSTLVASGREVIDLRGVPAGFNLSASSSVFALADGYIRWKGHWDVINTPYKAYDQVVEEGWVMIANKETYEHAAPITTGDPFLKYDGDLPDTNTTATAVDNIVVGQRYTAAADGWFNQIKLDITQWDGYEYRIIVIDRRPTTPVFYFGHPFSVTEETEVWKAIETIFVYTGDVIDVLVQVTNHPQAPTQTVIAYDYNTPNNIGTPSNGEIIHADKALSAMRVSKTDYNGTDRSAYLATLTPGDKYTIDTTTYLITGTSDNLDYVEFSITPTSQENEGIKDVTFEVYVDAQITYETDNDYWVGDATALGLYQENGYDSLIETEHQNIIDIEVQFGRFSKDWDVVTSGAITGGSPSTGGAAETVISPAISWDGSLFSVPITVANIQILNAVDGVLTMSFTTGFAADSATKSREATIVIDNSANTSAVNAMSFTGATWQWPVGGIPTGLAAGAVATLYVYNISDTVVNASWVVNE